jgi:hypothetical protein
MFGELEVLGTSWMSLYVYFHHVLVKFFSASFVADTDTAILYQIEMSFVYKLFEKEPGLAMRFYCKLAQQLADNLKHGAVQHALEIRSEDSEIKDEEHKDLFEMEEVSDPVEEAIESSNLDSILAERFAIKDPREVVIKKANCALKRRLNYQGIVYLSQHYVCFHAKSTFGVTVVV